MPDDARFLKNIKHFFLHQIGGSAGPAQRLYYPKITMPVRCKLEDQWGCTKTRLIGAHLFDQLAIPASVCANGAKTGPSIEQLHIGMMAVKPAIRHQSWSSRKAAGRKPSRKAEITRLRILKAAAKVFARHGYHLALLGNIARDAGIHVTALYYYFDTKEHLVEEMLNRFATANDAAVRASVQALPAGASYRDKITAAAITQVGVLLSETDFMAAHSRVLYQVPQEVRDRHFVYLRAGLFFWRALVKGAWDSGEIRRDLDPSIATQILMGSLNWTPEWYRPGRKTPEEIARDAINIMFDGMAARRPVTTVAGLPAVRHKSRKSARNPESV